MAEYKDNSPWHRTPIVNNYLSYFRIRPIKAEADDPVYKIEAQYTHRPDLLAYDIYHDAKLWWVFAQRNMDVITDPIYDFIPGVEIYLPKKVNIKESLGI
jgi:hypothetical protein